MSESSIPVKVFVLGFMGFVVWGAVTGFSQATEEEPHLVNAGSFSKPSTPRAGQWEPPCLGSQELHGWITEARKIMSDHNIPGSYYWICKNIERESGGNPTIVNDWDINAKNGTPSIGLLQVIKTTWDAHWKPEFGIPNDQRHPVANIVVACAYAASRYGSIDNVDGPY